MTAKLSKPKKPRVILKCVANHYTTADERIIEFTFGPDGKGGSVGGLIHFGYLQGKPTVTVYRHTSNIEVIEGKKD